MSSQFAFCNLDAGPVSRSLLARAQSSIVRRGMRYSGSLADGAVGLGFTANHPDEASLYVHPETSIIVSADARIDNAKALAARLGLRANVTFAQLIARAYLKWGEECPRHLEGDFAFIIWDPREHTVFCARDRLGLKQILYHFVSEKVFACATDAKTLFTHDAIERRPNEARLLDFFAGALEGVNKTVTAYDGVTRLEPGHILRLKNGQLSTTPYWTLEPQEPLRLSSQGEYDEAFRAILTQAVTRRFDSPETTGVMVSGGLDSGAVAAMACQSYGSQLKSVSAINSDDPDCVETRMIKAVIEHLGLSPDYVDLAAPKQWMEDARSGLAELADPFDSNMTLLRSVFGAAQRGGMTAILDGAWGDTVFAPGSHVRRQMRAGQLTAAWRALKVDREYHGEKGGTGAPYIKMLLSSFLPSYAKSRFAPLKHRRRARGVIETLGLRQEFVNRHDLAGHFAQLNSHIGHGSWKNPYYEAAKIIAHPYHVVARERYDRVAGHFGIIARDPFTDLDLVKFCLSLPSAQKISAGQPKTLLRSSMQSFLPTTVTSRLSKEHLGFQFSQYLLEVDRKVLTNRKADLSSPAMEYILRAEQARGDACQTQLFAENWLQLGRDK